MGLLPRLELVEAIAGHAAVVGKGKARVEPQRLVKVLDCLGSVADHPDIEDDSDPANAVPYIEALASNHLADRAEVLFVQCDRLAEEHYLWIRQLGRAYSVCTVGHVDQSVLIRNE